MSRIHYSYSTHTLRIHYAYALHMLRTRYAYTTHTLRIRYAYAPHTLRIRCAYATLTLRFAYPTLALRIRYAYATHMHKWIFTLIHALTEAFTLLSAPGPVAESVERGPRVHDIGSSVTGQAKLMTYKN